MKTIVITGVTGAIGKATVQEFSKMGNVNLVLVGRSILKMNELKSSLAPKNTKVDIIEMDLSDMDSVKKGVETINNSYNTVDALVNIAAVYKATRTLTKQKRETMFATNHLAPFALTLGILPNLKKAAGSKILTVSAPSSTKIDFDNLNGEKKFSAFGAFGGTKMMNLLFSFKLAKELRGGQHASMAFHPGLVKTELLNEAPAMLRGLLKLISSSPEKTAKAIVSLVLEGDVVSQNGKFYNNGKKELKAASSAYDTTIQEKLWQLSENFILN
jgi:short-subunit dehydrogenase